MIETLLDKPLQWLAGDGPEADLAVGSYGVLARNLADFPFPARCSDDERRAIEERVLGVLDNVPTLSGGQYCSLLRLPTRETRFLLERRLIVPDLVSGRGPRGVLIAEDQCASVMINGSDHIVVQVVASGLQLPEAWARLSTIDDALSNALDFAFHKRLGHLTASLGQTGTGLRAAAILHLPGLAMSSKTANLQHRLNADRHLFDGMYKLASETLGDLYLLSNQSTLGRSEEETLFHLRHCAMEVMGEEHAARDTMLNEMPRGIQDRVGRALGVARGARLLEFGEALSLLSSIRLGVATGNAEGYALSCVNDLLFAAQPAHLEMKAGHACNELTLSMERADLFRARFS